MTFNVNTVPDWQNLSVLSKNRLKSRSYFIPYESEEKCLASPFFCDRKDINSERFMLLSGMWKFSYFRSVLFLPENIFDLDGKEEYVPSTWQAQGYEDWNYVNIDYPFPVNPPEIPNHNPVGVYSRRFSVPETFKDKTVKISFLGVSSAFHLYINRREVGYGQVSHSTNEFDVTPFLNESGENEITVVVYKWCDGSYLEDQDCFRHNGIFRDVFLTAQPKTHIRDFFFTAEKKGSLSLFSVKTEVETTDDCEVYFRLISPCGKTVYEKTVKSDKCRAVISFDIENPELWNAENPKNYTLFLSVGKDGNYECLKQTVGFKCAEIIDSVLYLNDVPIKIKGVNRHDSDPFLGTAVPFEHVKKDLMLIKSLNCNAVRTSHYPNDPCLVAMANFMGLYIISEVDLETHGFRDAKTGELDWSVLSKNPEWKDAYLDRLDKMLERDKNNPCVLFWSMGNESGDGENLRAMVEYTQKRIPGAIVHYCEFHNPKDQIYSEMYPEHAKIEEFGKNKDNDPSIYFMCEYAHSMGVGPGSFKEYWDIIYKYPRLCGGCVWEWCDHAKGVKMPDGSVHFLYGGDNGDYPHNGNFCCDGIVLPDRTLSTGAYEMKEAYSPFRVFINGDTLIFENVLDFTSSDGFEFEWKYTVNGKTEKTGTLSLSIPAHKKAEIKLPVTPDKNAIQTAFEISFIEKDGKNYRGHAVFELSSNYIADAIEDEALEVAESAAYIDFCGKDFKAKFSRLDGTFVNYEYKGEKLIKEGYTDGWKMKRGTNLFAHGPRLNLWRNLTDNDIFILQTNNYTNEKLWQKVSSAKITEKDGNHAVIKTEGVLSAPLHTPAYFYSQTFTVHGDGTVEITSDIKPYRTENLAFLGRVGLRFDMPGKFDRVEWFGLGERENYPDFKLSASYGVFEKKVRDMNDMYIKPQENGNRSECRYVKITDEKGTGFKISGDRFNFGVKPCTLEEAETCAHHFELPDSNITEVCVDGFMSGLGSNSCGPRPLPEYILDGNREYSFTLVFKGIGKD